MKTKRGCGVFPKRIKRVWKTRRSLCIGPPGLFTLGVALAVRAVRAVLRVAGFVRAAVLGVAALGVSVPGRTGLVAGLVGSIAGLVCAVGRLVARVAGVLRFVFHLVSPPLLILLFTGSIHDIRGPIRSFFDLRREGGCLCRENILKRGSARCWAHGTTCCTPRRAPCAAALR